MKTFKIISKEVVVRETIVAANNADQLRMDLLCGNLKMIVSPVEEREPVINFVIEEIKDDK